MSFPAMGVASKVVLPPAQKLILLMLASYSNDEGYCFPSQKLLAEDCMVSDRTVRGYLKEFEDKGFLTRVPRYREDGGRRSDGFQLHVDNWPVKKKKKKPADKDVVNPPEDTSTPSGDPLPDPPEAHCQTPRKPTSGLNQSVNQSLNQSYERTTSGDVVEPKIPVTGNRLIHPTTGEPATDAERLEIFNSFSDKLAEMMVENGARRPKPTKAWTDAIRLLLESDGVDPREAWKVLVWSQHDGFWKQNIHSLPKFRDKYDQLLMKKREKESGGDRKKTNAEIGHELVAKYEAQEKQEASMFANLALDTGAVVPEIEYSAEEVYQG